ncbi:MAG: sulfite oxidase [Gammaproteobacteria bacterium]|jgi:DMSO/TMAO reductase YedYZ molybdopterin-dependent catalytic subunit|nr:sulfite oxidase [Gammaproteobacteria bacterium]|tara:strand:+ start:2733 stop:4043 length:1311 start_codon:yes stop_codon:yes gene_type:complete
MKKKNTDINDLYAQDPIAADRTIWGRETSRFSRRGFLKKSGLITMSAALGMTIPFARLMPAGLIPAAFAADNAPSAIPGKDGLIILNDRPMNAETPAHLLNDDVTPNSRMFIRNNGLPPENINSETWQLEITGESCERPRSFSIAELRERFEEITLQLQLECGGNGRSEFIPAASGNQWTTGAVGCPSFTGVRLRDVLNYCGVKTDAAYVGYYGADTHTSGDASRDPISRGVPINKAMERESLIAWQMNGEDIPLQNGYPLRMVCAGWPGSVSGKWLNKIVIRDQIHDGEKMAAPSYSVPTTSVAPGSRVPNEGMRIIESMPVKSLLTFPQSGISHSFRERLVLKGHAWAGDNQVSGVFISIDFGASWLPSALQPVANRLAWQNWQSWVQFPEPGYYEVWVRAMDDRGRSQPMVVPGWNPRGYLNNACHRVAVQAV